jgi:hypothetical protein
MTDMLPGTMILPEDLQGPSIQGGSPEGGRGLSKENVPRRRKGSVLAAETSSLSRK